MAGRLRLGWEATALGAALLCLCVIAPGAQAWREVPAPNGQIVSLSAATADAWLVSEVSCCGESYQLTEDGGASWTGVQLEGFSQSVVAGADADGSFRLVGIRNGGSDSQEAQVFRVGSDGTAEAIGPAIVGRNPKFNGYAVAEDGSTWVPHWDAGLNAFALTIVAADGGVTKLTLPDSAGTIGWEARSTLRGMRLLRFVPDPVFGNVFARGTFRVGSGSVLPAEPYPVSFEEGNLVVSSEFGRGSWDGGASWGEAQINPVPRGPGTGVPRYLLAGSGVAERYSPFLYRDTGLVWPASVAVNAVVDAGPLIAWGQNAIYVEAGPMAPLPTAIGQLQPDTQRLLARADEFRADAGLPPLTGDATISLAARNHSNYGALHPDNPSPHEEEAGQAGFTGVYPWDRCAAVGTHCDSEVMYSVGFPDPVGGWLATIYHRPLPGSPEAGVVGGAVVNGGPAVMDGGPAANVLTRPFGYPVGRWRGEAGFGHETPDPVKECAATGQPISEPLGIAVSLYLPNAAARVSSLQVRRQGGGQPLSGCLLEDEDDNKAIAVFILDEPLVAGAAYDVSATWNPGPDELAGGGALPSADQSYDWSFRSEPDHYSEAAGTPGEDCAQVRLGKVRSTAARRRPRHARGEALGIEEKLAMNRDTTVSLRRARLTYQVGRHRRSISLKLGRLKGRGVEVGRSSVLSFRLPSRAAHDLRAGKQARLSLSFTGSTECVSPISFNGKVSIGWVRIKGAATWANASAHKHR